MDQIKMHPVVSSNDDKLEEGNSNDMLISFENISFNVNDEQTELLYVELGNSKELNIVENEVEIISEVSSMKAQQHDKGNTHANNCTAEDCNCSPLEMLGLNLNNRFPENQDGKLQDKSDLCNSIKMEDLTQDWYSIDALALNTSLEEVHLKTNSNENFQISTKTDMEVTISTDSSLQDTEESSSVTSVKSNESDDFLGYEGISNANNTENTVLNSDILDKGQASENVISHTSTVHRIASSSKPEESKEEIKDSLKIEETNSINKKQKYIIEERKPPGERQMNKHIQSEEENKEVSDDEKDIEEQDNRGKEYKSSYILPPDAYNISQLLKYYQSLDMGEMKCTICSKIVTGQDRCAANLVRHLQLFHAEWQVLCTRDDYRNKIRRTFDLNHKKHQGIFRKLLMNRPQHESDAQTISTRRSICNLYSRMNSFRIQCKICSTIFFYRNVNDTHLIQHIKTKHKDIFDGCYLQQDEQKDVVSNYEDEKHNILDEEPVENDSMIMNALKTQSYFSTEDNGEVTWNISGKPNYENDDIFKKRKKSCLDISKIKQEIVEPEENHLKTQKEDRKRSKTWNYFSKIGPTLAKCHLCKNTLFYGSGNISNLTRHLLRVHSVVSITEEYIESFANRNVRHSQNINRESEIRNANPELNLENPEVNVRCLIDSANVLWFYYIRLKDKYKVQCSICNEEVPFINGSLEILKKHLFIGHNISLYKKDYAMVAKPSTSGEKYVIKCEHDTTRSITLYRKQYKTLSFFKKIDSNTMSCNLCGVKLHYNDFNLSRLCNHLWISHVNKFIELSIMDSDSETTSETAEEPIRLWEIFTWLNENKAQCSLCSIVLSYDGNFNILKDHMRLYHYYLDDLNDTDQNRKLLMEDAMLAVVNDESPMKTKQRSWVWRYFFKKEDFAECCICSRSLSIKAGNISNLARHLERNHSFKINRTENSGITSTNEENVEKLHNERKQRKIHIAQTLTRDLTSREPAIITEHYQKIPESIFYNCKHCRKVFHEKKKLMMKLHFEMKHKFSLMHNSQVSKTLNVFMEQESTSENVLECENNENTNNVKRNTIKRNCVKKFQCKICTKIFYIEKLLLSQLGRLIYHLKSDHDLTLLPKRGNIISNIFEDVNYHYGEQKKVKISHVFKYFKNITSSGNKCKFCHKFISSKIQCKHYSINNLLIRQGIKQKQTFTNPVGKNEAHKKCIKYTVNYVSVNAVREKCDICQNQYKESFYCNHLLKRYLKRKMEISTELAYSIPDEQSWRKKLSFPFGGDNTEVENQVIVNPNGSEKKSLMMLIMSDDPQAESELSNLTLSLKDLQDEGNNNEVIAIETTGSPIKGMIKSESQDYVESMLENSGKNISPLNLDSTSLQKNNKLNKVSCNVMNFQNYPEVDRVLCTICCKSINVRTNPLHKIVKHLTFAHSLSCVVNFDVAREIIISSSENDTKEVDTSSVVDKLCKVLGPIDICKEFDSVQKFRSQKKSPVWKHFEDLGHEKAKCNHCKVSISYKSGAMNNLTRHLRLIHAIVPSPNNSDNVVVLRPGTELHEINEPAIQRGASPNQRTEPKRVTTRSKTWKYFTKTPLDWAQCNICKKFFSFRGGTINNLTRHLRTVHPKYYQILMLEKQGFTTDFQEEYFPTIGKVESEQQLLQMSSNYSHNATKSRKKSHVWTYFKSESSDFAICNFCLKRISYKGGGTSNLSRHLRIIHGIWIISASNFSATLSDVDPVTDNAVLSQVISKQSTNKWNTWDYMEREGLDRARCQICNKQLSFKSKKTIYNLTRHLRLNHPSLFGKTEDQDHKLMVTTLDKNGEPSEDEIIQDQVDTYLPKCEYTNSCVVILNKQGQTPPTNIVTRARPKTSFVWNYFEDMGKGAAQCNICYKKLSYKGGATNNLVRHLKVKHSFVIVSDPGDILDKIDGTIEVTEIDSVSQESIVK